MSSDATAAGGHDYRELDAQLTRAAAAVESGELDGRQAVAQIALAVPGRVDLLDRVIDAARRRAGAQPGRWPPAETELGLAEAARRIVVGEATLNGPEGVRVEQTVPPGADRITRTILRLTKNGRWECDCRTADELGRHIDLTTLTAALAANIGPHQ